MVLRNFPMAPQLLNVAKNAPMDVWETWFATQLCEWEKFHSYAEASNMPMVDAVMALRDSVLNFVSVLADNMWKQFSKVFLFINFYPFLRTLGRHSLCSTSVLSFATFALLLRSRNIWVNRVLHLVTYSHTSTLLRFSFAHAFGWVTTGFELAHGHQSLQRGAHSAYILGHSSEPWSPTRLVSVIQVRPLSSTSGTQFRAAIALLRIARHLHDGPL